MATTESTTRVKTLISTSYSLLNNNSKHLLRRELHKIKDKEAEEFITSSDTTIDVGDKDDWLDHLMDVKDRTITKRDDAIDLANDEIEILDSQILEIDEL